MDDASAVVSFFCPIPRQRLRLVACDPHRLPRVETRGSLRPRCRSHDVRERGKAKRGKARQGKVITEPHFRYLMKPNGDPQATPPSARTARTAICSHQRVKRRRIRQCIVGSATGQVLVKGSTFSFCLSKGKPLRTCLFDSPNVSSTWCIRLGTPDALRADLCRCMCRVLKACPSPCTPYVLPLIALLPRLRNFGGAEFGATSHE